MHRSGSRFHRLLAALLVTAAPLAHAATIEVPPITVQRLQHVFAGGVANDYLDVPGPDHTSSGFTATISDGDVVVVRIQAAPGMRFVFHPPAIGTTAVFSFNFFWVATGGFLSQLDPHVMTFENQIGASPTQTYSLVALGDDRGFVEVWKTFRLDGPLEFTAIRFDITATPGLPPMTHTFADVGSFQSSALVAVGTPLAPGPLLELLPMVPVTTKRSSWGAIKSLYR